MKILRMGFGNNRICIFFFSDFSDLLVRKKISHGFYEITSENIKTLHRVFLNISRF